MTFAVLGNEAKNVNGAWDGSPLSLQIDQNARLSTPNGSLIFAYTNEARQNSAGKLSFHAGGGRPEFLSVPPLSNTPEWIHKNWEGNQLSITNVSGGSNPIPIRIQAIGPGIPGNNPKPLTGAVPVDMAPGDCAAGNLGGGYSQIVISNSTTNLATLGLIGGPAQSGTGKNAYTFTVNAMSNSVFPEPNSIPPPGDYKTTSNRFELTVHWPSHYIFLANLSGVSSIGSTVKIRAL